MCKYKHCRRDICKENPESDFHVVKLHPDNERCKAYTYTGARACVKCLSADEYGTDWTEVFSKCPDGSQHKLASVEQVYPESFEQYNWE